MPTAKVCYNTFEATPKYDFPEKEFHLFVFNSSFRFAFIVCSTTVGTFVVHIFFFFSHFATEIYEIGPIPYPIYPLPPIAGECLEGFAEVFEVSKAVMDVCIFFQTDVNQEPIVLSEYRWIYLSFCNWFHCSLFFFEGEEGEGIYIPGWLAWPGSEYTRLNFP